MTFGDKISQYRRKIKLSQTDLAIEVGITRDTISKYERNILSPSFETAKKIAQTLDLSLDFLANDKLIEPNDIEALSIDNEMNRRINQIENLSAKDKDRIISVIDAFVRDASTRQAYGM